MNQRPLVSIITVVYNAEGLIDRTMRSVKDQSYQAVQHVVVDGNSSDNTVNIVKKYSRQALVWLSEKDLGIYDAMNKGIGMAEGDFLLFLNAGDTFYHNNVLADIFTKLPEADVYYGNTEVVDQNGKRLADRRLGPPKNLNWHSLQYGMCVSHQSLLVRKSLGITYDLRYRVSSDIDWTIRVLKSAGSIVNTHGYIAKFLEGGVSNEQRKIGLRERWEIMVNHYGLLRTVVNHGLILVRFVYHKITRKSLT